MISIAILGFVILTTFPIGKSERIMFLGIYVLFLPALIGSYIGFKHARLKWSAIKLN